MRGDFSRIRFNPAKEYVAALKQQGRVDTDADANEQRAIDLRLRQTTNTDVIGQYGGPENDAGFAVTIVGEEIWFSPGRYYVNGILVENRNPLSYDQQPCLIDPTHTASDLLTQLLSSPAGSTLGLTLQVWQRMVTALDDPCLLEPALQNADTTVRLQTVWRVLGTINPPLPPPPPAPAPGPGNNPITQLSPCCQALYSGLSSAAHSGEMGAGLAQAGTDCGCQPIPAAGYQGLENQLYRVEIHTGSDLSSATFKWSRENASVVTQVTQVGTTNASTITVTRLGPDANLGFQAGQWVELSDDTVQFGETPNQPGTLYQIASISQAALQVTMTTPVVGIDTTKNARMRRWDQSGASATATGIAVASTPIPLENGIQVQFQAGQFQPGDYWTIPARTANGQIDWPPCGADIQGEGPPFYQPSKYMRLYQAPIACIGLRFLKGKIVAKGGVGPVSRFQVNDCRLLFPPLIDVNLETTPAALHVSAVSWTNDNVMTTDMLLENGLSITFDQGTTCPWGGGNFRVEMESPNVYGMLFQLEQKIAPGLPSPTFSAPAGTDVFIRNVVTLDPPWGITVSGNQVSWLAPIPSGDLPRGYYELWAFINAILLTWTTSTDYGRVRIRLIGGAVYGSGATGNLYLDGQSFGQTGTRAVDGSECVNYEVPSGNSANVSDYEGWFYLAPTVYIANVAIQGLENNAQTPVSAVTVVVNNNNQVTGLEVVTPGVPSVSVTNLQAVITLSYPPIAQTTVTLALSGTGAGSVVSVAATLIIPAGTLTGTATINVLANPGLAATGAPVIDTVTLVASVPSAIGQLPATTQPTLSVTGVAPPTPPAPVPLPIPAPPLR